jgi:hypothetical protein
MGNDTICIEMPTDPRYLDVAVAAVEALATRAGIDKDDFADLRASVHAALAERISRRGSGRVTLRYNVGEGFLGLRVEDLPDEAGNGTTS